MQFYSEIIVTLNNSVKDTQGAVVETILSRMNIDKSAKVTTGKYFTITIEADNIADAESKINLVCEEVFTDPVLETYKITRLEQL